MLVRQLTKQLSRSLNTALSGIADAITKVLIDLSPTSNGFYSLGTPFQPAGGFEIEFDFSTSSTATMFLTGSASDATSFIAFVNSGTAIRVRTNNASLDTGVLTLADGLLHTLKVIYESGTVTIILDNTVVKSGAGANGSNFGVIGQASSSLYFDGIISNVKLRDLDTPANSLEFNLNQLTANTETNNGVTLTYQNISTDARDTYTLIDDDYVGSEQVVNGDFANDSDWNKGTNITISGGKAVFASSPSSQYLDQLNVANIGSAYNVSIKVSNYVEGAIFLRHPFNNSIQFAENGTLNITGVSDSSTVLIRTIGVTTLDVDSVTVKRYIEVA